MRKFWKFYSKTFTNYRSYAFYSRELIFGGEVDPCGFSPSTCKNRTSGLNLGPILFSTFLGFLGTQPNFLSPNPFRGPAIYAVGPLGWGQHPPIKKPGCLTNLGQNFRFLGCFYFCNFFFLILFILF